MALKKVVVEGKEVKRTHEPPKVYYIDNCTVSLGAVPVEQRSIQVCVSFSCP